MARSRTIELMNTAAQPALPPPAPVAMDRSPGCASSLSPVVALVGLLLGGWLLWANYDTVTWWAGLIAAFGLFAGMLAAIAWLAWFISDMWHRFAISSEHVRFERKKTEEFELQRLKLAAEVAEAEAKAAKAKRDSEIQVVIANWDQQVHISDMNHAALWRNTTVDPRVYANGHYTEPRPEELHARQMFLASVSKSSRVVDGTATALPAPEMQPLPDYVDLFELLPGQPSIHKLVFGVAIDETTGQRQTIAGDLLDLTHIAIAGSSGWGKSSLMRSLIYQAMLAPEKPDLLLVDLENNALAPFAGSSRLLRPLAANEADARRVFGLLFHEMYRRLKIFEQLHVDDLKAYGRIEGAPPLKPIVCAVDEFNDLMELEDLRPVIQRVARHCRKTGIRLIFAAQEWTMKYIDGLTQRQLSTRFQFYATDPTQARQLVGPGGKRVMEKPKKGRAVALLPGKEFALVQTPYLHRQAITAANPNAPAPPENMNEVRLPASPFDTGSSPNIDLPPLPGGEESGMSDREQVILETWDAGERQLKTICEAAYGAAGGKHYDLVRKVLTRNGRLEAEPENA